MTDEFGKSEIEWSDRYTASGITPPPPGQCCPGQCEGIGLVPIHRDDSEEPWHTLWLEAEKAKPTDDGFHFVICPECGGSGRKR